MICNHPEKFIDNCFLNGEPVCHDCFRNFMYNVRADRT